MKKILATVYAINPYKGSENGMGWSMVLEIARHQHVLAITRENNQQAIENYMRDHPNPLYEHIEFAYFDLPYWMRFWKKGGRGALLYYYLWQIGIVTFIKKSKFQFDIVHNLNFHNDWTPSFLWRLKKPMVWGPVGHHPIIPSKYLKVYGWKIKWKDRITWIAKHFFWHIDPFLRMTKNKADRIIAMNSSVGKVLNVNKDKIISLASVGSEPIERFQKIKNPCFSILSIGRFVALKGFDISIASFANFFHSLSVADQNKVELILVGKGSEEDRLKALIRKYNVVNQVKIINWVERSELARIYRQADVFLFPSHEGAGMVVAEAMSYGLPVLCFDNIGPGEMVDEKSGIKIPYSNYEQSVLAFAKYLNQLYNDPHLLKHLSGGASQKHKETFRWEIKSKVFQEIYQSL
jgi:glycosyltransferase involved in cell wall biosynthesis